MTRTVAELRQQNEQARQRYGREVFAPAMDAFQFQLLTGATFDEASAAFDAALSRCGAQLNHAPQE